MQHFKEFLIKIQSFELRTVMGSIYKNDKTNEEKDVIVYDIGHETPYYAPFTYRSQLRVMKDMALIDLIALSEIQIKLELEKAKLVLIRFNDFWKAYHNNHNGYEQVYKASFPFSVRLDYLFITYNLEPDNPNIHVGEKFVEDLGESVKLRESLLKELVYDANDLIRRKRYLIEVKSIQEQKQEEKQGQGQEQQKHNQEQHQEAELEPSIPKRKRIFEKKSSILKSGTVNEFFDIIKEYFSEDQRKPLYSLLYDNKGPSSSLLFTGNGKQLADAFKQVYEANLIPGYKKIELEEWIAEYFKYTYKEMPRDYTAGYLNGIISTDDEVSSCKSPIIDVKRDSEDNFHIIPAIKNKKSYKK